MDASRIEGGSAPQRPAPAQPSKLQDASRPGKAKGTPPEQQAMPVKDSIEFSQQARELASQTAADGAAETRIEAAKRRLAAGELDTPAAYNKAAEKLLRSGQLDVEA